MNQLRAKTLLPAAMFIWVISPSFYWLWQAPGPVETSLLPPLSFGQRLLSTPHLILEQLGFWLWPMSREPLTFTIAPDAVMREGLFFCLILALFIRFGWRLRRVEPWIFYGPLIAVLTMLPFSGIFPSLVRPFSSLPLLVAGFGLAMTLAALLLRGIPFWRDKQRGRQAMLRRHGWRATSLLVIIWLALVSINLIAVMGRIWEDRINAQIAPTPELVVAVEIARQYGQEGKAAEAEALIIRCGQAAPWYAEVPVVKAELLLAQDMPNAARVHLQHALELNPTHERAKKLLEGI